MTITFERVSLQFPQGRVAAVRDCSLATASGHIVVILGPSGCGKTTLLKMVNRLYQPTAGQIYLNGQDINQFPIIQLRQRIGYVIQQGAYFPT